jgi:signal transduction histidine kinase
MDKEKTQVQQAGCKTAADDNAGRIIHNLNNILSSILGFAELAKMGLKRGATVDKDLDEVVKAGMKARDLVSRLSDFIHHAGIRNMPFEVSRLVRETMNRLGALLPASIDIRFHGGDVKGEILTDPVQFRHVLMIICIQVSHAMKKKAGRIEILLKDTRLDASSVRQFIDLKPGNYLELRISDRENGKPVEIGERICAPRRIFEYTESDFPQACLVQDMVKEMGGAISVGNESEKGNRFHILFPKYEKESDEAPHGATVDN